MNSATLKLQAAPSNPVVPNRKGGRAGRLKTLATLAALTAVAPLNLALVVPAWIVFHFLPDRREKAGVRKTILISGGKMTKALQLARSFDAAGHKVILAETGKYRLTGHRFSRAVHRFVTVPDPTDPGYAAALVNIVKARDVDVYVPVCSPVASLHDSLAIPALSSHCEIVHLDPARLAEVDDKFRFSEAAQAIGLKAPKSIRITDPAQVEAYDFSAETRPFILKSIAYDAIRRLDLTFLPRPTRAETRAFLKDLPISESNPWVLQEFIEGREYCTHGTARNGRLTVHICCESSPFQINYDHIDHPDIRAWVETFVAAYGITGQVSFDFMKAGDDGAVYAIECNPRTHSAITLFKDQDGLPGAYLGTDSLEAPLEPAPGTRPTYWLYHELIRLVRAALPGRNRNAPGFAERLGILARGRDAVFSWRDPWPFFMLHHVHIPSLLLADLRIGRGWKTIDFNIGKLVQDGGD